MNAGVTRATFLIAFLLVACRASVSDTAERPPRPNIVLIMADDLGFSDLGCYGGEIETPNLDRLAREGLQFTQFYNCAVCVTTRAALMTGLHPRHGSSIRLRENMVTLAEVLRAAGYRTSLTGKWHLGSAPPRRPTDRGFEEYYGVASGCCNYFDPYQPDPEFYGGKRRPFLHNERRITEFPAGYYMTDAFTDHTIQQIRQWAEKDEPFFVHLCHAAPHFPLHAKPQDIARYKGRYDQGYFAIRQQRYRRQLELGILRPSWKLSGPDRQLGDFLWDYDIAPWEQIEDLVRERRRMEVYAAMVDSLDQGIGRILATLEETGVADNTLVMFLSDNGGCASYPPYGKPDVARRWAEANQELPGGIDTYDFCAPGWGWAQCTPFRRYKVWTYEGGIATPMIARWPNKIQAGSRTDQVGHLVDFMPTVLELSGANYPATRHGQAVPPMEGRSLLPVFEGENRAPYEYLCWYLMGNRAVRHDKWKLVWGVTAKRWELYDMDTDRTETRDLAGDHPGVVAELSNAWQEFAVRVEVPLEDRGS